MNVLRKGIDVSSHQKNVDVSKVKNAGYTFVMIRVGFRGYSNGNINADKFFMANIKGASREGLDIGCYFFSTAINEEEAREEAKYVLERIKGYKVSYPIVYDFEGYKNPKYRTYGIKKAQRTANCKAFNEVIKNAGYKTMLYGSQGNIRTTYDLDVLQEQIWCAKYPGGYKVVTDNDKYFPNIGKYTERVAMWQYTSIGKVDGISGNVDLSNQYKEFDNSDVKYENPYSEPKGIVKYNPLTVLIPKEDVKWVQWELVDAGYKLSIDGRFGKITLAAVKDYQAKHGLVVDGIVGPKTKESMKTV